MLDEDKINTATLDRHGVKIVAAEAFVTYARARHRDEMRRGRKRHRKRAHVRFVRKMDLHHRARALYLATIDALDDLIWSQTVSSAVTPTDPATIAAGLTANQREWLPDVDCLAGDPMLAEFVDLGLAQADALGEASHTPLGRAVAKHLEADHG